VSILLEHTPVTVVQAGALPAAGTPVMVLYVDDRTHAML
jgi:hypothetical protein